MALVALTTEQKIYQKPQKLARWCLGKLAENKISHADLARFMGTTDQNISQRFKNDSVTIPMLVAVIYLCEVPAEELERILKL